MAFNPQEQSIIQWGQQNGKTKEDVTKAIGNFRAGITPAKPALQSTTAPANQDTYGNRVLDNVGDDVNKRIDRTGEILNRKDTGTVEKGVQLLGQGMGLVANTAEQTVGQIPGVKQALETYGKGVDWLSKTAPFKAIGDAIGSNKALQETTTLYDTDPNFKDTVDGVANMVRLYGDAAMANEAANFIKNTVSKIKNPGNTEFSNFDSKLKEQNATSAQQIENGKVLDMGDKSGSLSDIQNIQGEEQAISDYKNAIPGQKPIPSVSDKVSGAISGLVKGATEKVKGLMPKSKTLLETAIEDATPNYESSTPTERKKLLGRVKEGGILKERTVSSDDFNNQAGEALSKVPGYNPKATKLEKFQTASKEASRQGENLSNSIKAEKVVVPKKVVSSLIKNAISKTSQESLLLQSSDPIIKQYMRVMKNALTKETGTLDGVYNLRKTLDDAYENARGKQAFGSDKISALDDIHKASRDALNKYLIDNAQNVDVKASLKAQWDLYRAIDELRIAAEKESGSSVGRVIQNNPITSKAVELGAKATGLGQIINTVK